MWMQLGLVLKASSEPILHRPLLRDKLCQEREEFSWSSFMFLFSDQSEGPGLILFRFFRLASCIWLETWKETGVVSDLIRILGSSRYYTVG